MRLGLSAIMRQDASSDGSAIGFCAFELNLNPVGLPCEVVAQKRRRFVKVDDNDVNIAIIIEIPESAAAAAMLGGHAGPCFVNQLLKYALPQVPENRPRSLVGILREFFFNMGIHVTCGHKQVWIAIVIQIHNPRAPTHVTGFDAEA